MTLALLQPGWEAEYAGQPSLNPVVCVGKIIADQRLDDGRFNLLVRGLSRARIVQEVASDKPYRKAQVNLLPDILLESSRRERRLRRLLIKWAPAHFAAQAVLLEQLHKLLKSDLPLGTLCDIVAFALPLSVEVKQELLEEVDVEERARRLVRFLHTAGSASFRRSSASIDGALIPHRTPFFDPGCQAQAWESGTAFFLPAGLCALRVLGGERVNGWCPGGRTPRGRGRGSSPGRACSQSVG